MELTEAMRTTGTCRFFRPDPVPDDVLRRRVRRRPLRPAGRQPPARPLDRGAGDAERKQALPQLYLPHVEAVLRRGHLRRRQRRRPAPRRAGRRLLRRAPRVGARDRRRVRGAQRAAPDRHGARTALGGRRRVDLPDRPEPLPRPARPGRRLRVHHAALHRGTAGPRPARHPGRVHHGGPHRGRLPGQRLPRQADAHAGGGDRLLRDVRASRSSREAAWQHRAPSRRARRSATSCVATPAPSPTRSRS